MALRSIALGLGIFVAGIVALYVVHRRYQEREKKKRDERLREEQAKKRAVDPKKLSLRPKILRYPEPPPAPEAQDLDFRMRPGGPPCRPGHPGIVKPCNPVGEHGGAVQHLHQKHLERDDGDYV